MTQAVVESAAHDVDDNAEPQANELMERVLGRCTRLYTLPSVAVEILRLTGDPQIDVAEIKTCVERDPALTTKILRVVNSSLYGLSTEIGDLNQAVALLGINPLKLLVLGFSLPDNLFAELAGDQLQRYWATALVRAVAAKAIAEKFYGQDGNDAFLAGLVDDLGMLALLGELGEPYARFLRLAWEQEGDVRALERKSLGFDHGQLTVALLTQWNMPSQLVQAVANAGKLLRGRQESANASLAQVLYLGSLMAELVGRHRLDVLPELLEAGYELCRLDKSALNALVEELEPIVAALGEALQVRLPNDKAYLEIMVEAHTRFAELGEDLAGPLARMDRAERLLAQVKPMLQKARSPLDAPASPTCNDPTSASRKEAQQSALKLLASDGGRVLSQSLRYAIAQCRVAQDELSLVLIGAGGTASMTPPSRASAFSRVRFFTAQALDEVGQHSVQPIPVTRTLHALVLPRCSRRDAIELARRVLSKLDQDDALRLSDSAVLSAPRSREADIDRISAGVASLDSLPRVLEPERLFDAAYRCLSAAHSSGGTVKSIELF